MELTYSQCLGTISNKQVVMYAFLQKLNLDKKYSIHNIVIMGDYNNIIKHLNLGTNSIYLKLNSIFKKIMASILSKCLQGRHTQTYIGFSLVVFYVFQWWFSIVFLVDFCGFQWQFFVVFVWWVFFYGFHLKLIYFFICRKKIRISIQWHNLPRSLDILQWFVWFVHSSSSLGGWVEILAPQLSS